MARVLIKLPAEAKRGEVIEIRVLISHPMESGQRRDEARQIIPRKIINAFVCAWNGEEVVRAELFPAIAANPFLSFTATATESGTISMTFVDDDGATQTELRPITVT